MPHPKNHLKLTGDTHLPDVGDDDDDLAATDMEPGADFDAAPPAAIRSSTATAQMSPRQHRRAKVNLTKTFALLALGLVLLRVFR